MRRKGKESVLVVRQTVDALEFEFGTLKITLLSE